jgi:poly(rC)-binding protein 2/3/4
LYILLNPFLGVYGVSFSGSDDFLIVLYQICDDQYSPTIEAALRLQPRCSEKMERDSGLFSFTTRLLVPSSHIGCLLGKGGLIIDEMRKLTKAIIRIPRKENLPKVASDDDEMVQVKKYL